MKNVNKERVMIKDCFAKHYFNNNKQQAYQFLEAAVNEYKSTESSTLIFLLGAVAALFFIVLFLLIEPGKPEAFDINKLEEALPIFRFILCIAFAFMWSGIVIENLKEYRVNYVIIFESNPANRVAPSGMYILSAIVILLWLFWLIGEIMTMKNYVEPDPHFFAYLLIVLFLIMFLLPFPYFQSVIRFPIITGTVNALFSPFSEVRFLEFFIGDVLTSFVKPFIDVAMIAWFANKNANPEEELVCHPKMFWAIFAWYLPFHIRFWQCINKWYNTGDAFPHLANAGKYFSSIVMIITNYHYGRNPELREIVIFVSLFASTYSYIWDILMDWRLYRDGGWLRETILYPPKYYYFSAITNLFLRFLWLAPFFIAEWYPQIFEDIEVLTAILCLAEIYRRAQWSLFRLEIENIYNFEKYRTILEIPRLPRDA